jgi:membrane protease YdiL (CAAX protease family)
VKPYTLGALKDVAKLAAYFIATVLFGALIAPLLFWSAQSLAQHGAFSFLARYDFETFFHRAILIAAAALLWPLLRLSRVRCMADLGLRHNSRWGRDLFAGAAISVVPLLCFAVVLVALQFYSFRHSFAWPRFGKILVTSIVVPLIEEPFFRGIILGLLLRAGRKYAAIFVVSALFAVVHFLKAPDRTSTVVTWTSGFSSIAHAFDGVGDPMLLFSALATLFFIGWILADARVLTYSLWLPIGLHAGWIFGSAGFARLARQQTLALPWIGKNMLVGIIPLVVAALTWLVMRAWLKYDRTSQV